MSVSMCLVCWFFGFRFSFISLPHLLCIVSDLAIIYLIFYRVISTKESGRVLATKCHCHRVSFGIYFNFFATLAAFILQAL